MIGHFIARRLMNNKKHTRSPHNINDSRKSYKYNFDDINLRSIIYVGPFMQDF